MKELPKVYEPQQVESSIYEMWMENDCFKATPDPDKKPYSIVMPPPNVTGQLHMGHALDATLQDILTRYKRMQGYSALWLPGTDHAGIATQIKVEEELRVNEGKTRYDLGREKFLERVWAWKEKYGSRIVQQQKKLGVSCDWSRSRFTMDEGCSKAVREAFCEMYEKGLIYKGSRIINWCPHCLTALSDAEVEYTDKPGHLWYIRYPLADGSGDIVVATTRPETMMGDTGVAVNPEDEKFKHLIGKTCILPIMNREIPNCRIGGEIYYHGTEINQHKIDTFSLRTHVGMVFQQPNPFHKSIYENIAFAPRKHGITKKADLDALVEKSLRQAAIWDEVKDKIYGSAYALSGGQQQRLCIARTLAMNPDVILMDEPCSALDPIATFAIEETIRDLAQQGMCIIIVTHNMEQAMRVSDRTAFFLLGDMIETGETAELFSHPKDQRLDDYLTGRFG